MKNDSCKNSPNNKKTRKRKIKSRLTISERTCFYLCVCVCSFVAILFIFKRREDDWRVLWLTSTSSSSSRAYRDARETLDEFTPGGNEKLVTHKLPIINRRVSFWTWVKDGRVCVVVALLAVSFLAGRFFLALSYRRNCPTFPAFHSIRVRAPNATGEDRPEKKKRKRKGNHWRILRFIFFHLLQTLLKKMRKWQKWFRE